MRRRASSIALDFSSWSCSMAKVGIPKSCSQFGIVNNLLPLKLVVDLKGVPKRATVRTREMMEA